MATRVKLRWGLDTDDLIEQLASIIDDAAGRLLAHDLDPLVDGGFQTRLEDKAFEGDIPDLGALTSGAAPSEPVNVDVILSESAKKLIPKGFISEKPLKRVLALRLAIEENTEVIEREEFFFLALSNTVVSTAGNLGFGPEVYRKSPKEDAGVLSDFFGVSAQMIHDLTRVQNQGDLPSAWTRSGDARTMDCLEGLPPSDLIITSPPYPNEKDYTRSTRLETVLLGLVEEQSDVQDIKRSLLVSNSRNCYVDVDDGKHIEDIDEITSLADRIEEKRIELGKDSGFEKKYHEIVRHYFGGMYLHFESLKDHLNPGAKLAYVVGDQQSYFRINIPTADLLEKVGKKAGYQPLDTELWRERFATETEKTIDENVLLLEYPG
ncbi:hypothetical protein BRD56_00600 [Thermoplasmatales archaeon SW_10_69_26]|nr:MAG: hypothetical protein BRD56_00600 [Thermoplasmatales archaeon SW_10_69_26]